MDVLSIYYFVTTYIDQLENTDILSHAHLPYADIFSYKIAKMSQPPWSQKCLWFKW